MLAPRSICRAGLALPLDAAGARPRMALPACCEPAAPEAGRVAGCAEREAGCAERVDWAGAAVGRGVRVPVFTLFRFTLVFRIFVLRLLLMFTLTLL